MYDYDNLFAKIIVGKLKADKIYENNYVLAFKDINPVAPIHVLIVPKGHYIDFSDFMNKAKHIEILEYYKAIQHVVDELGVKDYRLISNKGSGVGQTIFHFHTHIIAGKLIDKLLAE